MSAWKGSDRGSDRADAEPNDVLELTAGHASSSSEMDYDIDSSSAEEDAAEKLKHQVTDFQEKLLHRILREPDASFALRDEISSNAKDLELLKCTGEMGSTILHLMSERWVVQFEETFSWIMKQCPKLYLLRDQLGRTVLDRVRQTKKRRLFLRFFADKFVLETVTIVSGKIEVLRALIDYLEEVSTWPKILKALGQSLLEFDQQGNPFLHNVVLSGIENFGPRIPRLIGMTSEALPRTLSCRNREGLTAFQLLEHTISEPAISVLLTRLEDSRSTVRSKVIEELGRQPALPESAISALLGILDDEDSAVRVKVIQVLGRQSALPDSAILALLARLEDEDSAVRVKVIQVLGENSALPQSAISALLRRLEDPDRDIRSKAAQLLGGQLTLPESVISVLVRRLENPEQDVRLMAVKALRRQSSLPESAITALLARLEDPGWDVKSKAAQLLGGQLALREPAISALLLRLEDPDETVRSVAVQVLGGQSALPESAISALLEQLKDPDGDVQSIVVQALKRQSALPTSAISALLLLLEDPDEVIRSMVVQVLGEQSALPESAISALLGKREDPDRNVRSTLGEVLGRQFALTKERPPVQLDAQHIDIKGDILKRNQLHSMRKHILAHHSWNTIPEDTGNLAIIREVLVKEILRRLEDKEIHRALYKRGEEREFDLDLTHLRDIEGDIPQDSLNWLIRSLKFETYLRVVRLPFHPGVQPLAILNQLRTHGIKGILTLEVDQHVDFPDPDENIERALAGWDIEQLDWRKIDLSTWVIFSAIPSVRHLRLYASGNLGVLKSWSAYDGLPKFQALRRVNVTFLPRIEPPNTIEKYSREFFKRMGEYHPNVVVHTIVHPLTTQNESVSSILTVKAQKVEIERPQKSWATKLKEISSWLEACLSHGTEPSEASFVRICVVNDGLDLTHLKSAKVKSGQSFDVYQEHQEHPSHKILPWYITSSDGDGTAIALNLQHLVPFADIYVARIDTKRIKLTAVISAISWAISKNANVILLPDLFGKGPDTWSKAGSGTEIYDLVELFRECRHRHIEVVLSQSNTDFFGRHYEYHSKLEELLDLGTLVTAGEDSAVVGSVFDDMYASGFKFPSHDALTTGSPTAVACSLAAALIALTSSEALGKNSSRVRPLFQRLSKDTRPKKFVSLDSLYQELESTILTGGLIGKDGIDFFAFQLKKLVNDNSK